MKKAAAILSLLFLTGCTIQTTATKQFYVKSGYHGYYVAINTNDKDVYVSKAFSDPRDADIIVKELNRDMEGNWEK